ncbi:ABC transporter substrate-binding protein [Orrella marina]|uniref:SsuA/THI5-like domain-containing protein n=1 Tax=Orrella marina TaxID=2163011 RepID=A0A2R4XLU1_9BURK|nr:ABC transporter substrate-binding protein [Orrella marina]AWB34758.1 hypothetical protein DBV39_14660 [Orrella marina]
MKIVLAENFRTVFYTPFYAAYAKGEFARLGVDVSFVESPTPGSAIELMYQGKVDVVWGGPLRAIKLRDDQAPVDKALLAFCEVVGKDPFFLVTSIPETPANHFALSDLMTARLAVVSEVPTPWLCLQEDIRDAGLNPSDIDIVSDKTMAQNLEAVLDGSVAYAQLFEPYVSLAVQRGARIVYKSADRGMTAYTTFLSTASSIERNREAFEHMATAIENVRDWINHAEPSEIVQQVKPFYPHIDTDVLETCIARYQKLGLWTCQRKISEDGFYQLRQSMKNGSFINSLPQYDQCVIAI